MRAHRSAARAQHARVGLALVACGVLIAGAAAEPARASHQRTALLSGAPGLEADGASTEPTLSADGRRIAFVSLAGNLGGPVPGSRLGAVYTRDRVRGTLRLESVTSSGLPADGASSEPAIAADRQVVAWTSPATNFVVGDTNGAADVFVRSGSAPVTVASVAVAGGLANGPSSQPMLSRDGRFLAFSSTASNLVAGDTNGVSDVFVRDLQTGRTIRASVDSLGGQANGASTHPALSGDGTVVSFGSTATNLVQDDTNRTGDVFVRDLQASHTRRVSVSSRRRQQNRSMAGPFPQVSSLNADGRLVAFDSDATNLVRRDVNRKTDVFVHDRRTGSTVMASLSSANVQGDSDSFFPTLSGDGRYVAFNSLAGNIAPDDPPREDVMLRDLRRQATSLVNVPDDGGRRDPESVRQVLQQPDLTHHASLVVFTSSAGNLVSGDSNRALDVFVRNMRPPATRLRLARGGRRPLFVLGSPDRRATSFHCRMDGRPVACSRGTFRARALRAGRHRLTVRAGGPGMRYDPRGRTILFTAR